MSVRRESKERARERGTKEKVRKEGRKEGRKKGRKEGRKEERKKGRKKERKKERKEGRKEESETIRKRTHCACVVHALYHYTSGGLFGLKEVREHVNSSSFFIAAPNHTGLIEDLVPKVAKHIWQDNFGHLGNQVLHKPRVRQHLERDIIMSEGRV